MNNLMGLSIWATMAFYVKTVRITDLPFDDHRMVAMDTQRTMYKALRYQVAVYGANMHPNDFVGDYVWKHDIRKHSDPASLRAIAETAANTAVRRLANRS